MDIPLSATFFLQICDIFQNFYALILSISHKKKPDSQLRKSGPILSDVYLRVSSPRTVFTAAHGLLIRTVFRFLRRIFLHAVIPACGLQSFNRNFFCITAHISHNLSSFFNHICRNYCCINTVSVNFDVFNALAYM